MRVQTIGRAATAGCDHPVMRTRLRLIDRQQNSETLSLRFTSRTELKPNTKTGPLCVTSLPVLGTADARPCAVASVLPLDAGGA